VVFLVTVFVVLPGVSLGVSTNVVVDEVVVSVPDPTGGGVEGEVTSIIVGPCVSEVISDSLCGEGLVVVPEESFINTVTGCLLGKGLSLSQGVLGDDSSVGEEWGC